jgi:hypothetical protein
LGIEGGQRFAYALTLALLYGLFAPAYGVTQIGGGRQRRSVGRDVGSVLRRAA